MIFRGSFCSPNLVKHFFCHMRAVVRLSCLDSELTEFIVTAISVSGLIGTFLLIILIYVFIVTTILRIPSAESKQKSFLPVPPTSQWSSSTLVLHLLFIWSQKHQGEMTQWSQFPTLSSLLSSALSFSASGIRTWRMLSERPLERHISWISNLGLWKIMRTYITECSHKSEGIYPVTCEICTIYLFPEVDIWGSSDWVWNLCLDKHSLSLKERCPMTSILCPCRF